MGCIYHGICREAGDSEDEGAILVGGNRTGGAEYSILVDTGGGEGEVVEGDGGWFVELGEVGRIEGDCTIGNREI